MHDDHERLSLMRITASLAPLSFLIVVLQDVNDYFSLKGERLLYDESIPGVS